MAGEESLSVPSRRTRLALPMLTLVRGGMGGTETYARELIRQLAVRDDLSVTALVSQGGAGFSEGVTERVVPGVNGGAAVRDRVSTLTRGLLRAPALRRMLGDADVVHYPFSVPVPPPPRDVPMVQTLHDVQHRDLPHLFSRLEILYRSALYDRPARSADAVITISQFSRTRAVERLGLDPDRVHVAPLGVDADAFRPNTGGREGFVLYPARGWPHKNHSRLFEAMALVRRRHPGLGLVLTGGGLDALRDVPDWVDVRGFVSHDELLELYRNAACLAFPSLYEGFGLPPLEAMASGCPVAAADTGAVAEVCGDAAVLFDPEDPESMAHGIEQALEDTGVLATKGLDRVRSFTWKTCADVHARVYHEVSGGRTA